MKLSRLLDLYRWQLFVVGLLVMSVSAQAVLVYVATRADAPAPLPNYYERARAWDVDAATLAASHALGLRVVYEIPRDAALEQSELRPVDVDVRDRDGEPVLGLAGRLLAVRPADTRLNNEARLVALPQTPGRYRALARLPVGGVWLLGLDATLGQSRFVHSTRVEVVREAAR